ncbi:MAG: winged helix-turn-helix transcriptional regulator [Sedimentisphaerales bacterium]|nr:winged helix-turn-helix transcriptional regulator [Sedimentisphaerales bacterium]
MLDEKKLLLFEKQAGIAKSIAHPLRLAILNFLKDGEQCVCDIAKHLGAERSNVSRHLATMSAAGVLKSRKKGLKVIYELQTPCILDVFSCVTRVLKHQAKENEKLLTALK